MASDKQTNNRPWLFQPGKSGNPKGRPPGTVSLKTYAQKMIMDMTDEEKMIFLKGLDKKDIWEMAEGKPKADVGITGNLTISQVLDELEHGPKTEQQGVEDK